LTCTTASIAAYKVFWQRTFLDQWVACEKSVCVATIATLREVPNCYPVHLAEIFMGHIGELLRVIRLEWGLTLREVMERSHTIANIWGSPSHVVSFSHLAKVEMGKHDLTVDKFMSLSEIYSKSPETLLRTYRPHRCFSLVADPVGGPSSTRMITEGRLGERAVQLLPDTFDKAPAKTIFLPSRGDVDRNRYKRVIVGTSDLTLSPLIRPGTILKIDTHKRAIATYREWSGEFDRPIYLLYTREGHMCAWCELDETGSWLTTVPHICSKTPHRHLKYGQEVQVVGRAVGLAMNLET
jgi:transcriptional regulator with XRE-family HTH domain